VTCWIRYLILGLLGFQIVLYVLVFTLFGFGFAFILRHFYFDDIRRRFDVPCFPLWCVCIFVGTRF
jgi:hypothetical protein